MWFDDSHMALWHLNPTMLEIQQEKPLGDVKEANKQKLGPTSPLV